MHYGLVDFLRLLGSLGLFIYGMKMMSEGLQRAAGEKLRNVLRGMTSTRVSGIFTGFFTTSLIQSSSATTVMVVSFVNAGLLTLTESMGVIMGANIGTTVTAWIISIFGFKVKIDTIAIILIGLAFPFLFVRNKNYKHIAEFIIGFGILFIGLEFIKNAVPDIKQNPELMQFITPLVDKGFFSILIFVLIGTLLTIVIQSSSATMAVTLVMLSKGWIELPMAAAMVLGENIGTTVTANIAAIVGNVNAKRAARFHFLFNIVGVIWMLIVFPFFLQGIEYLSVRFEEGLSILVKGMSAGDTKDQIALSLFHSTFNILNVLLLVWFVPVFEKIVTRVQPSHGREDEEIRLKYISGGLLSTPELSLAEAKKEMQFFAKLIAKMNYSLNALLFEKHTNKESIAEKIKKREDITDHIELELVNFLTKISESDLSEEASRRIPAMLSMANDLERIADIYYQMTKNYERMVKLEVQLPEAALQELKEMMDLIDRAIKLMRENMEKNQNEVLLKPVFELEDEINATRKRLRSYHFDRLEKNVYPPRAGVIFLDYVNRAERIGDHIVNVNEALAGIK